MLDVGGRVRNAQVHDFGLGLRHLHGHRLRLLLDVGGRLVFRAEPRRQRALARDGGAPDSGAADVRRVSNSEHGRCEEEDGNVHFFGWTADDLAHLGVRSLARQV